MSTKSFFIIGPFSESSCLYSKIKNLVIESKNGQIKGTVYKSKVGFPILCNQGENIVKGLLIKIQSSDLTINIINELMGYNPMDLKNSLHIKQEVSVELEDGQQESAFVYFINSEKLQNNAIQIENGDWEKFISTQPPIPLKLNEKQRIYIQKLGQSSGRDIIPIDISLYRELMNMELVIDKGRRIALTKLGQEVFRYL